MQASLPNSAGSSSGLGGLAVAAAVAAGAGIAFYAPARSSVKEWVKDRVEDIEAATLPEAQQTEKQQWVDDGAAGPELRSFRGTSYKPRLERQLVERGGGSGVHQHEMIWLQNAAGGWVLVEALLDSGNNVGLAVPQTLAHELGYADEQGLPHARYRQGSMHISTANGPATVPRLRPIAFSIAGHQFSEATAIQRTPSAAELRALVIRSAGTEHLPGFVVEAGVRQALAGYCKVLVSVHTICQRRSGMWHSCPEHGWLCADMHASC
ncbi:hypothetical protein ABPG75_001955 [Micractinium tetrahymenae]